jgi:DNA replication and repair protein RecF
VRLGWVELRDFRNHEHTELHELGEGLSVAVGPNGEGKTNLLEGMFTLYAVGSPRASSSEAIVRDGRDNAYARGEFHTLDGRVLVELEIPRRGAAKIQVNRSPVRRRRDLRRQVRVVMFGPFDLPIVLGDPAKRRAFLDEAATALHPARDTVPTNYEKVLRQRNRLLKEHEGRGAPPELEAWDDQLVTAGVTLMEARREAAARFADPASTEFVHLAGYGLEVAYRPNVEGEGSPAEAFRRRLEERRPDELVRRTSLVGPHRDDLHLAVRDLGARAFGSHGETLGAALCLRLGLASAVGDEIGEPPVLLIDDPFSALDPARRDRVAARLAERAGQIVISVADDADVPPGASAVWDVRVGTVTPRAA